MTRRFAHQGWSNEIASARDRGITAEAICGKQIKPLSVQQAADLEPCPVCEEEAQRLRASSWIVRLTTATNGGAA